MARLLLRRLLVLIPLLLVISFLSFLLLAESGGDAFSQLLSDPQVAQAQVERWRALYGLDRPLPERYLTWLGLALQGDLGRSLRYQTPVLGLIGERLGHTLLLSATSLVLTWLLAVGLGCLAALRPRGWLDRLVGLGSYLGLSLPRVLLALVAIWLAAATGLFPVGGMVDQLRWDELGPAARAGDLAHHLLLPVAVLTLTGVAGLVRQVRSLMVEALGRPSVQNARALGLPEHVVVLRHGLRHALNPLITQLGQSIGHLLTGSFLVEVIFAWPGLAVLTYEALLGRDVPLVQASVLLAATLLVVGNLLADLLLAWLDPRLQEQG